MATSKTSLPHIALFPSAEMGHLTPFLRLAAMFSSRGCIVTLITAKPTLSSVESDYISYFLSTHPEIRKLELQVNKLPPPNTTGSSNLFLQQFDAISRSVHLLHPALSSSSPPISAFFCDLLVASGLSRIADDLGVPYYLVSTTSARFLGVVSRLPIETVHGIDELEIPGMPSVRYSSIPPPFFDSNHLFTTIITSNAKAVEGCKGVLVNSFNWFEPHTTVAGFPPVHPIGPLQPYELEKEQTNYVPWLDNQPDKSVVFVCFGSRTSMSRDQIRELRNGLLRSECRFLWVLKTENSSEEEVNDLLLGDLLREKTKKGLVVNTWVNQQEVLAHPAIGGFVSHCGWNSVMEAAHRGTPVLAWPQAGDQRVNAEIVEMAGLGIWEKEWGWGSEILVSGEKISEKIVELMKDENLKSRAKKVGEEARKASGNGGNSEKLIMHIIHELS